MMLELPSPSAWVVRWSSQIDKPGPVLDLACGSGRNAKWLQAQGYEVIGLDRDRTALASLAPGIEGIVVDLEDGSPWPLGNRQFKGIVVTNYLYRPLFPSIHGALADRGTLIYETFALGNERFGRPSNPDYLLRHGELLEFCRDRGLVALAYESVKVDMPRPAMIQRMVARKTR